MANDFVQCEMRLLDIFLEQLSFSVRTILELVRPQSILLGSEGPESIDVVFGGVLGVISCSSGFHSVASLQFG